MLYSLQMVSTARIATTAWPSWIPVRLSLVVSDRAGQAGRAAGGPGGRDADGHGQRTTPEQQPGGPGDRAQLGPLGVQRSRRLIASRCAVSCAAVRTRQAPAPAAAQAHRHGASPAQRRQRVVAARRRVDGGDLRVPRDALLDGQARGRGEAQQPGAAPAGQTLRAVSRYGMTITTIDDGDGRGAAAQRRRPGPRRRPRPRPAAPRCRPPPAPRSAPAPASRTWPLRCSSGHAQPDRRRPRRPGRRRTRPRRSRRPWRPAPGRAAGLAASVVRIRPRRYSAVKNIAATTTIAISPTNAPARLCSMVAWAAAAPPGATGRDVPGSGHGEACRRCPVKPRLRAAGPAPTGPPSPPRCRPRPAGLPPAG